MDARAEEIGTAVDSRDIWLKELGCPLCKCNFKTYQLKSKAYKALRREPDFYVYYEGTPPWIYEIAVCPVCAFAGEARNWSSLAILNKEKLRENLDKTRPDRLQDLCDFRTLEDSLETFHLATTTYEQCSVNFYRSANVALRGGYVARALQEDGRLYAREDEISYKQSALELFLRSYETERIEETRFGASGITYIIGELCRQLGEYKQAVIWFSRTVSLEDCHPHIKRLARNQWELSREEFKGQLTGGGIKVTKQRTRERAVLNLYSDQLDWARRCAKAAGIKQDAFLRVLFDALMESNINWGSLKNEEEILKRLQIRDRGREHEAEA